MSDVKFACPGCQRHMKVGLEYVGVATECPDCNQKFKIPSPPGEIKFMCGGCKSKLALHESYVGAEISCPGCSARMVVPNPKGAASPATPGVPKPVKPAAVQPAAAQPKAVTPAAVRAAPATGPKSLPPGSAAAAVPATPGPATSPPGGGPQTMPPGSLPGAEPSLTAPPAAEEHKDCPQCGGAMSSDAKVCTMCGFNIETGEVDDTPARPARLAKPADGAKPPPPPPPGKGRKPVMPKASGSAGSNKTPQLVFYILTGIGALLLGFSFLSAATFAFLGFYFYLVLGPVSSIWALVDAFGHSTKKGLLSLFIPFYVLFYVYRVSKNRMLKAIFNATLATALFFIIGLVAIVVKAN